MPLHGTRHAFCIVVLPVCLSLFRRSIHWECGTRAQRPDPGQNRSTRSAAWKLSEGGSNILALDCEVNFIHKELPGLREMKMKPRNPKPEQRSQEQSSLEGQVKEATRTPNRSGAKEVERRRK
ncbi:hypothetical protein GGX14DRAFT_383903 [Mycena pura]|uniref:Secreted protein n=1 Tax=Mycena pura TaxID=153505 RepID=A0AAD6YUU1_9AGAR|nr:hypothetical protein GGX14DRAFT_383903 [Mycena pura]